MTQATSTLLADGRELIYFDDGGTAKAGYTAASVAGLSTWTIAESAPSGR